MDPEQTAPIGAVLYRSSLIWVHNFCHRGFLNISADEKQTSFVAIGALRVKVNYILVTQCQVSASGPKVLWFPKNSFRNAIRVSNSVDPENVEPERGPNCFGALSSNFGKRPLAKIGGK